MADIVHCIQIAAPAEAVAPLFASARGFTKWWAEDVIEVDGSVELGFFNRNTQYRLKPQGTGEWLCETGNEWAGTRLIFKIEPRPAGVQLRFTHGGWKAVTDYFLSCNTTWGELMYRLKAEAEGKSRGPLF